jgi:predicted phosphate transport protein (TIGR00153 family)
MALLFKNVRQMVLDIEKFISTIEEGVLVFKEGVSNYLNKDHKLFSDKIQRIDQLEGEADELQKKIDDGFYLYSIMPQVVSDVETMIDHLDEIIDEAKEILWRFDDEMPDIPKELVADFKLLNKNSVQAAKAVFPAAREFFKAPTKVKEMLTQVYFYENEADNISRTLRRKIFREMEDLDLSRKMHLNYFAIHIETISDKAENLADVLSILALKMSL